MKTAVVGIGSAGRRHIANLLRLRMGDVIAVSEHNCLPSLSIEETPIDTMYSYNLALDSDIDAVIIANPSNLHLDYARRAIAAGKHVYLEKPVAVSTAGVGELIEMAAARGVTVAVGTQNRFHQPLEELHRRLGDGEAGTILQVTANLGEHIEDYHPLEDYRESYTTRQELGGGVLLTQIHQLDYLNWLFGPFKVVYAIGGRRSDLDIDVEDSVSYMLQAADGTPVCGHLDYLQRPKRVSIDVFGSRTSYRWDYFGNRLEITAAELNAETDIIESPFDRNALFVAALKDFFDAITTGRRPRSDLSDGLAALEMADAIRQSCRTGATVELAA